MKLVSESCFFPISVSVSCKALLTTLPSLFLYSKPFLSTTYMQHNCTSASQQAFIKAYSIKVSSSIKRFLQEMEIKVEAGDSHNLNDQEVPLLQDMTIPETEGKTLIQKAISQTFQSTAHLANLLPTGTVLAFQLLSPIVTNQGECDPVSRSMTAVLVALCGMASFLLCFTDSVRDKIGNVCYGFATIRGLWIIDGSATIAPEDAAKYRLQFIDFMHAFMSILVFAAIALFDQNVANCFYPTPSDETKELLTSLPVGVGVICSMLFVVFPTRRHGIGFPLSAN